MFLDFNLKTSCERVKYVENILKSTNPSPAELEKMADYILFPGSTKDAKEKNLISENHQLTINKRETSLEKQVEIFDEKVNHLFTHDKNVIFRPSIQITPKDKATIAEIKQIAEAVDVLLLKERESTGLDKYRIKKAIIELRKDQYVIKEFYNNPTRLQEVPHGSYHVFPRLDNIDFTNPKHVSECLCLYSKLKQASEGEFQGDTWYMMEDLDHLIDHALVGQDRLKLILILKIDGKQNSYIKEQLQLIFGLSYTPEYISSLWRHKIPELIAKQAVIEYEEWYYTFVEKGKWKTCSRCGNTWLASTKFFSRNKTSKDGLYSICKKCRSVRKEVKPIDRTKTM